MPIDTSQKVMQGPFQINVIHLIRKGSAVTQRLRHWACRLDNGQPRFETQTPGDGVSSRELARAPANLTV